MALMAVVQKRYAGAEIPCIRTKYEKRMLIKCHACAENQGEPDVAIMGVVQKRHACAEILCIRTKDEKRMIIKCHACAENQGEWGSRM